MWFIRTIRALVVAALTVGMVLLAPAHSLALAWSGSDSAGPATNFGELRARAMEERDAGEHASAARSFAAAYKALEQLDQRVGARGEYVVSQAVDDFRHALEADPDDLQLLEEEAALLQSFAQDWTKAHAEGSVGEPTSVWVMAELVEVRRQVESLRRSQRNAVEGIEGTADAVQPDKAAVENNRTAGIEDTVEIDSSPGTESRPVRGADFAILSSGLVCLVGGASLFGGGLWTFGAADERREAQLAKIDSDVYPHEDRLRANLEDWDQRGHVIATWLSVSGAVLAIGGIGLTTWGAIRFGRARRQSGRLTKAVTLVVSRQWSGAAVTVGF